MKPLFSLGPITFYFFGLMIAIGAVIGYLFLVSQLKKKKMDVDLITNGVLYSLLGGIIGARLIYVLVYDPTYYLANPINILYIQNGGLSIHGGILGGLLTGYIYIRKHKQPVWEILDMVAPALILAQGISRIGCDVFGAPTTLPWGIHVNGSILHPAQAYEFILDYILFGYLWFKLHNKKYSGQIFVHYLITYSIIRGLVEFTRINPIVFGPFSVSHVLSLIGVIVGIIIYKRQKNKPPFSTEMKHKVGKFEVSIVVIALIVVSTIIYYLVQG